MTSPFQRARRPEQLEVRRSAILAAARDALAGKSAADVTLGGISERAGLAKSNLLRYFDSREAILLEVLLDELRSWLDELTPLLAQPLPRAADHASEISVADALTESLTQRRLLCDLLGMMAGVLERNITVDTARTFKRRTTESLAVLGTLIEGRLPWIGTAAATFVAEAALGLVAGTYPFSNPTEPVRQAITELGLPEPRRRFTEGLRSGLILWLVGAGTP